MADEEEFVMVRNTGPIEVNEQMCEKCHTMEPPLYRPCLDHNHLFHWQCIQKICQTQQSIRCARCGEDYRGVTPLYESLEMQMWRVGDFVSGKIFSMLISYILDMDPNTGAATQLALWNARSLRDLLRHSSLRRFIPDSEQEVSIFRRQLLAIILNAEPVVPDNDEQW